MEGPHRPLDPARKILIIAQFTHRNNKHSSCIFCTLCFILFLFLIIEHLLPYACTGGSIRLNNKAEVAFFFRLFFVLVDEAV